MKANKETMYAVTITRILLGLLMLVPGIVKLFVTKPAGVTGMLGGMGFPAATFFAWILILSEIIFGLLVIINFRVRLTTIPPIIIMLVAGIVTFSVNRLSTFLLHLVAASAFWIYGAYDNE